MNSPQWDVAPECAVPATSEVHVWSIPVDVEVPELLALAQLLSPDEVQRAARFRFERDRRAFVVGRSRLRMILGRYVDCSPDRLRFAYSPHGKPALVLPSGPRVPTFNVSNAGAVVVCAVTCDRRVGIDVERVRPGIDADAIAERFFETNEVAALQSLARSERIEAFFRCWTRKEAYVKARGNGLALALDQFEVSVRPGEPAWLRATRGDPGEAARWTLADLSPGPGYVGALAVEGAGWRLRCWRWAADQG
jgi:4'-phosphopantetheinyl transferase